MVRETALAILSCSGVHVSLIWPSASMRTIGLEPSSRSSPYLRSPVIGILRRPKVDIPNRMAHSPVVLQASVMSQ